MRQFREGLVFKAHRLLYRSTLGLRVTNRKMRRVWATVERIWHILDSQGQVMALAPRTTIGPPREIWKS